MIDQMEAVISGIVVGIFTLSAVIIQNRRHATDMTERMAHERLMAEDAFMREKVAQENEELHVKVVEQLAWGGRVALAIARSKFKYSHATTREERTQVLGTIMAEMGVDPNSYSPLAALIEVELLEDEQLRDLVSQHKSLIEEAFTNLVLRSDYEPNVLPDDSSAFIHQVKHLKTSVELHMRDLKRQAKPL